MYEINREIKNKIMRVIRTFDYYKGEVYNPNYIEHTLTSNLNSAILYRFKVESESTNQIYNCYLYKINNEITNTKCECIQFIQTGSCKHIAACLIQYSDVIFEDNSNTRLISITNQILDSFKIEEKVNKREVKLLLDIETESYSNESFVYINFKIGVDKLYIMNNKFFSFIQIYKNKEGILKFGKNFIYEPKRHFFNKYSEEILDFIYDNALQSHYYTAIGLKGDRVIKQFMKLVSSSQFQINGNIINNINGSFPFNPILNKKEGFYGLDFDFDIKDITPITKDYEYVLYNNECFHLEKKERDLLKALENNRTNKLLFKKDKIDNFSKGILPIIKDSIILDKSVDDVIISRKPESKLYFDLYYNQVICNIKLKYGDLDIDYFDKNNQILRDNDYENKILENLNKYGFTIQDNKILLNDTDKIGEFLENYLKEITEMYTTYTSSKLKEVNIIKKTNVTSTFSIGKDNIMSFSFDLGDIKNDELDKIFDSMKLKKKYYRLKSGDLINLDSDTDLEELEKLKDDMELSNSDLKKGNGIIPKYRAIYLDSLKDNKYHIIKTNNLFKELIDKFNSYKDADIFLDKREKIILRDYQITGVKWMYNIYKTGFGGILADEMGLGKSIQTIYFIKEVLKEDTNSKFLIIVPTSLAYNWENEFIKFAPNLKYQVIVGNKAKRQDLFQDVDKYNIIITTYGLLREDKVFYLNKVFKVCFIDEAQNIKNVNAMVTQTVKDIKADTKFALTGTPLENSVLELWSIFDFIMPGFLSTLKKFQSKYKVKEFDDDTLNNLSNLNKQITPFILRRRKADVIKELPDKIENDIYIELSDKQKKLYVAELNKVNKEFDEILATEGISKARFLILKLLMKLRQICIDPRIIFENYDGESNKIDTLIKVVKESVLNGHKILLFTSFKTALELVRKEFIDNGISSYTIDGTISSRKRMELVDKFNNDNTNVFLITLKAGGTGLNLTSADIVIHLDLWWNPQAENQATDRAHRIGQKKVVEVIKLITKGTIEEKIVDLQKKKKLLSDKLIESDERNQIILSKLSEKDIRKLLEYENKDE